MSSDEDFDTKDNPWLVSNIEEFLYFCCPECDVKHQSKEFFLHHAMDSHPLAKLYLKDIKNEDCLVLIDPQDVKEEPAEDLEFDNASCQESDEEHTLETKSNGSEASESEECESDSTESEKNHNPDDDYFPSEKLRKKAKKLMEPKVPKVEDPADNLPVDCEICHRTYSNKAGLKRHIRTVHENTSIFKCEFCDYTAKRKYVVQSHVLHKHSEDRKFKHFCMKCGKGFYVKSGLSYHEKRCLGGKSQKFRCDRCNMDIFGDYAWRTHNARVHNERESHAGTCETCGKSFGAVGQLEKHRKEFHPTKSELASIKCLCSKCHSKFNTSIELNDHLSTCLNNPEPLTCHICQSKWLSSIALKKHAAEVHQLYIWVCHICGESFSDHKKLLTHRYIHKSKNKLECQLCDKTFTVQASLDKHSFTAHGNMSVHHFTCPHCDMKCTTKRYLDDHINAEHTKETLHQCESCSYNTYRYKLLTAHVRNIHRPFKCDQCSKAYLNRRALEAHVSKSHNM